MPYLTDEEGKFLHKLARKTIEESVKAKKPVKIKIPENTPKKLLEKAGVFVTINKISNSSPKPQLRGCIGRILPNISLAQATIDSAIDSVFNDPRFPTVKPEELDSIIVEISVLTPPELIKVNNVKDYPKMIKVGRDGLIIEQGWNKGLLLPQVPIEQDPPWNEEEFLEWTCWKAHLTKDQWLDSKTKIYKFQAEIFEEKEPNGEVIRKKTEF
ncbi:MAG: TIGR00296 family protein [Candidatus Helarchaeota archaeon]